MPSKESGKEEEKKIDEMIDREIARDKAEGKNKRGAEKESKHKKKEEKEEAKKEVGEKELRGKDPWKVLKYPHLAEKAMTVVETENKLVFIVSLNASKEDIWEAVEDGFEVEVVSVRTQITMKGEKKAYVKLHPDYEAADVATRLGMI